MGNGTALTLKSVQLFIRSIQLACGVLILAIYSYILATLHNRKLFISTSVRAVEGIAGFACLYAIGALLFVCCFAGRTLPSFLGIILDTAFIACFIYVAVANKTGASSCTGTLTTPFGTGKASEKAKGSSGFTVIPTYGQACKLESACLGIAIIAIFFFCFSFLTTVGLARNHYREKRYGPGGDGQYAAGHNPYAAGDGQTVGDDAKLGFFKGLFKRNMNRPVNPENQLPEHSQPNQMADSRESHGTDSTAVGEHDENAHKYENYSGQGYDNYGGHNDNQGYGYPQPQGHGRQDGYGYIHYPDPDDHATHPHQQGYRYGDGVYDRA